MKSRFPGLVVLATMALLLAACASKAPTVALPTAQAATAPQATPAEAAEQPATAAPLSPTSEQGLQAAAQVTLDPSVTRLEKLDNLLSLVLALAVHPNEQIRQTLGNLSDSVELAFEGDPASDVSRVGLFLIVNEKLADPDALSAVLFSAVGYDLSELFGPVALDVQAWLYSASVAVYPGRPQAGQPLSRLANLDGVLRLDASCIQQEDLDISTGNTQTPGALWLGIDAQALHAWGLDGSGAIVGVIDSGIDWQHPDFSTALPAGGAQSRILYLWDQFLNPNAATDVDGDDKTNSPGEAAPPAGLLNEATPVWTLNLFGKQLQQPYSWGVEYAQAQITAALGGPPAARAVQVRSFDLKGHGTAVAGVAAGNGRALGPGRFTGVAPGADLVVVKARQNQRGTLEALAYITERAASVGRPVVVNYSRGNSAGPHDGSSDYDLDLAALLGPGRLLVTAGGNEADKDGHTDNDGGAAANGASVTRGFIVPAGNAGVEIAVWFTAANDAAIAVSYPAAGKTLTALPVRDGVTGQIWLIGAEMYVVTVQNYKAVPNLPNDRTALVMISSLGIPSGVATNWELTFQNRAAPGVGADGHFDAYILKGATFIVPSAEETITDPGNGRQVVTVGAFIHRDANPANDGTLAPFSSQGPTRDISTNLAGAAGRPGRRKPDISAPGRRVIMPRSNSAPVAIWAGNANYTQASGTSFAAPHMTGCAAIMLTRNAALAPADLLRWLPWFSRTDPAVVAGNAWGEGKLWCGADWDGDGVPLLVEDANLNGVVDPLETSDELEDSDGDGLPDLSQQWLLHSVLPH